VFTHTRTHAYSLTHTHMHKHIRIHMHIHTHPQCVTFLGLSGERFASGSSDNTIRVWGSKREGERERDGERKGERGRERGEEIGESVLSGHTSRVWALDATRAGDRLVSCSGICMCVYMYVYVFV